MSNLFIVSAYTNYDGSDAIAIFKNKIKADELVEACNLYQDTRPAFGQIDEDDEEFDRFLVDQKIWEELHPARKYTTDNFNYFDGFSVAEVLFVED